MPEQKERPAIRQQTVTRLFAPKNGVVARINEPYQGEMPPPSGKESVWRMFDTAGDNRIIVTQAGEEALKNPPSPQRMEELAHALHNVMREGRLLTEDDPFEYVYGQTPSREEIASGGEGIAYRIKEAPHLVVKIRMHHTMRAERYLEQAEAVRMALHLQQLQYVDVVPIYFMIFPRVLSEENLDVDVLRRDDIFDCVFMPYVEGPTVFDASQNAITPLEQQEIEDEYADCQKAMRGAAEKVSRSIVPFGYEEGQKRRDVQIGPMLDLSVQNAIVQIDPITGKRKYMILDYPVV